MVIYWFVVYLHAFNKHNLIYPPTQIHRQYYALFVAAAAIWRGSISSRKPSVRFKIMSACSLKSASVNADRTWYARSMVESRIFNLIIAYLRPTQLRGPALNGMKL